MKYAPAFPERFGSLQHARDLHATTFTQWYNHDHHHTGIGLHTPAAWPAAFEALIEAVNRQKVTAVALPSLFHFAAFGVPTDIRDSFERATGARVLVIRPVP